MIKAQLRLLLLRDVLLANCRKKAKPNDTAEHVNGDIGASLHVAHVLRQFFFPALRIREASLDRNSRHCYGYYNTTPPRAQ